MALVLPNVPQFTVAYFGCHYAGNPVVPLNVLLTAEELTYHLDDSEATAVVTWDLFLPTVAAAAGDRTIIVAKADLNDLTAPAGTHNLTALIAGAPPSPRPPTTADDTAVILYTSGTTGRPKGAELTHANLLANARVPRQLVGLGRRDRRPRRPAPLPRLRHDGDAQRGAGRRRHARPPAPVHRRRSGEPHRPPPGDVLRRRPHHVHRPSSSQDADLSTPEVVRLRRRPDARRGHGPLRGPLRRTLLEGYGLSETSPVASFTVPELPRTPGSIGYAVPGVELALLGDDGRFVATPGQRGEICVRGNNVMKGYWRNPEATADAIVDGWFRTGDIGTFDVHGAYRIVDRKKDLIIRGGYNVYPREVEEVLHRHPAVAQAAVVGCPHARLGEDVKAVVTLKPGATATAEDIIDWSAGHLAAYKRPRIVEIRAQLPVGPTGKVLKSALRAA